MVKRRKRHDSGFKARVALEAVKERETIGALSKRVDIHSTLIHQWKRRLLEEAGSIFERGESRAEELTSAGELYEQIGRLKVELEWLKKNSCRRRRMSCGVGWTRAKRGSVGAAVRAAGSAAEHVLLRAGNC